MRTVTLDFETYYDKNFSLSKMSTREHILSPLFEVIGVAAQIDKGGVHWFSGAKHEVQLWLKTLDLENSMVIAHNANFDGAILEWYFGIHPKGYFCTMMASRPFDYVYTGRMSLANLADWNGLGQKGTEVVNAIGMRRSDFSVGQLAKYAVYCQQDVRLCKRLALKYLRMMPKSEIRLLSLNIKRYTNPQFVLDLPLLETALAKHKLTKETALQRCGMEDRTDLMSNDKFATALMALGVDPPKKISPKTDKEAWAFAKTDAGLTSLLNNPNSDVVALVEARIANKSTLLQTRIEKFIAMAGLPGGVLPVPLLYCGTFTLRYSGLDYNLQNLPSRSEEGKALKQSICAPEGYSVVGGDLSQIEARMLATISGQQDLIDRFASGEDVYRWFAASLYGVEVSAVTDAQRFVGKTAILQLGYYSGANRFYDAMRIFGVDMPIEEADRVVKKYRARFPHIPKFWRTLGKMLNRMMDSGCDIELGPVRFTFEKIELPNGMYMEYPDLQFDANGDMVYNKGGKFKKVHAGILAENICSSLARIVITNADLRLAKRGLYSALQIHDELIYVIRNENVEKVERALEISLTTPVEWMPDLPVACEVHTGANLYEAK